MSSQSLSCQECACNALLVLARVCFAFALLCTVRGVGVGKGVHPVRPRSSRIRKYRNLFFPLPLLTTCGWCSPPKKGEGAGHWVCRGSAETPGLVCTRH
uniref:Uncharacterized protein n=1 Tax=Ixodes ricinus TaxID=34613 RepID=A0A6B0UB42_IXORI